jgi:hypothetical protein
MPSSCGVAARTIGRSWTVSGHPLLPGGSQLLAEVPGNRLGELVVADARPPLLPDRDLCHAESMADLLPLPRNGESFVDARGGSRSMRVSLHPEQGLVVFSIWAEQGCRASFQLPLDEAIRLSEVLDSVVASAETAPVVIDLSEAS